MPRTDETTSFLEHVFTSDGLEYLSNHLSEVLPAWQLGPSLTMIAFGFLSAKVEISDDPGYQRTKAEAQNQRQQRTEVHVAAKKLQQLLAADDSSLLGDHPRVDERKRALQAEVEDFIELTKDADPGVRRQGPGRPPAAWRDGLIAIVFACYPSGAAKHTRDGHFEQTVSILLDMLGREIEDVHGAVRDALRRVPVEAPFTFNRDTRQG